jgi:DNA-binding CsgD family transcriptional regulator
MARDDGWAGLFSTAFRQSSNAMVLVDARRRQVDANGAYLKLLGRTRRAVIGTPVYTVVAGGPLASPKEWDAALASGRFTGETQLVCANGARVAVQWGASVEVVTGRRLVLFVVLSSSRWGQRFRRPLSTESEQRTLTRREREIVRLVAHGSSGPEIAGELHIAHDTVRTHVSNAMTKLGARSRAHLVAKALGDGLTLE